MKIESKITLDPAIVKIGLVKEYPFNKFGGKIQDGDWDIQTFDWEAETPFYQSLKMRLETGCSWEETSFWKHRVYWMEKGDIRYGCHDIPSIRKRCEFIDQMYKDIKEAGTIPEQYQTRDWISVNINRNGRFTYNNGRHRLSCAKLAGIKSIPVNVSLRHKQWIDKRKQLHKWLEQHGNKLYTTLEHPDLQQYQPIYFGREQVFDAMSEHIHTVLDIGPMWGYFPGYLENRGKQCIAVEQDAEAFKFLEMMRVANGHSFKAIHGTAEDFIVNNYKFDAVIAFRIFHHFRKTKEKYQALIEILSKLQMKELYLQDQPLPPPGHYSQMRGAYHNFATEEEGAQWVVDHSCLTRYENLGKYPGGTIFRVFK